MSIHPFVAELRVARAALRRDPRIGGAIARTACFNVASTTAAALAGVIVARAVGPAVRGEYAAVTAWLGLLLTVGDMGQPGSVCFHVARDPQHARGYVATSRAIMLVTGTLAVLAAVFLAPTLAHGDPGLTQAYRIAFAGSAIALVGVSYTFALQAGNTKLWNRVRACQPLLALPAAAILWRLRLLTLQSAIDVLVVTLAIQLGFAYYLCRKTGLAPGRAQRQLVGPLVRYGLSQVAVMAPTLVNVYIDQLVLSQVVPSADLGDYAVAVSASLVPLPFVSAIGNVAFPHLAARRTVTARASRLRLAAVAVSAGIAGIILLPIAATAWWLIPAVFGPGYQGVVPLLWLLVPGGLFLAGGQVAGDMLRGSNRSGLVAIAQGFAAVFTVILLVTLLPEVGVAAAAIASTTAYGIALALMIRWLRRPPAKTSLGER